MYPQNSTACVWAGFMSKQYDNTALPYRYVNIFTISTNPRKVIN